MSTAADPDTIAVDRAGWPSGPWDNEPDRIEFRTKAGFPGLIHRNRMGALCGYVAVPPGHPLHGKGYDDIDVSVHGGLTYASACADHICHVPEPGEPDNVWWLGFDCAHAFDVVPRMRGLLGGLDLFDPSEADLNVGYRDVAYVRA